LVQELENYLHSQKTEKRDELREIAQKMISSEILEGAVSSELCAYELRCTTLVSQVSALSDFLPLDICEERTKDQCPYISCCGIGMAFYIYLGLTLNVIYRTEISLLRSWHFCLSRDARSHVSYFTEAVNMAQDWPL